MQGTAFIGTAPGSEHFSQRRRQRGLIRGISKRAAGITDYPVSTWDREFRGIRETLGGSPVFLPELLVRREKEKLILLDATANGAAILVLVQRGPGLPGFVQEKVVGIEDRVPEELPR